MSGEEIYPQHSISHYGFWAESPSDERAHDVAARPWVDINDDTVQDRDSDTVSDMHGTYDNPAPEAVPGNVVYPWHILPADGSYNHGWKSAAMAYLPCNYINAEGNYVPSMHTSCNEQNDRTNNEANYGINNIRVFRPMSDQADSEREMLTYDPGLKGEEVFEISRAASPVWTPTTKFTTGCSHTEAASNARGEVHWTRSKGDSGKSSVATATITLFAGSHSDAGSDAGLSSRSKRTKGKGKQALRGSPDSRGRVRRATSAPKPPTSSNVGGSSTMSENNQDVSSDPMSPGWRSFERTKSITDLAAQLEVMHITGMGRNGEEERVRVIHNTQTGIKATIDSTCRRLDSTDHDLTGKTSTFGDKHYRDVVRDMLYCEAHFRHLDLNSNMRRQEGRLHLISNAILVSCGQSETTMPAPRLANLTEEFCRQQMAREKSCESEVLSLQVIRPRYRTDKYVRKAREIGPSVQADDVTLIHVGRS